MVELESCDERKLGDIISVDVRTIRRESEGALSGDFLSKSTTRAPKSI